ncbi:MAG: Gfo/Idh/MocA family protein [Chloroflexota bacterium]
MNICMVGYGSIARCHVETLREQSVDMHTVVGRLPEPTADFAEEYGFRAQTTNLDDALANPEIDAVVVCSPSGLHYEQTAAALRAGKHVLTEIPLALSLREVDELIALADRQDRRLMVCHTQRYYPGLRIVRERIAADKLHVHHIIYRNAFLRRGAVNWMGRQRSWIDNLLWHHGCHLVDATMWLLGATDVQVDGHLALPAKHLGIPMDLSIVMRTPQDQLISIAMSYNSHIGTTDCLIVGEEDSYLFTRARMTDKDGTAYEPAAGEDPIAIARYDQDAEFLAAVREGREPAISGRAVRPAMAVLQEVQDQFERWAPPGAVHPLG